MFPVEACHQRYKGSTADHYAHLVNRAGGALSTGVLWRYLQDALLAAEGPPVDPDNTSWRLEPPLLPEGSEQHTDILACCGVTRGASSLLAAGPRILQAGDHLRVGDAVYALEGFCHDFNTAKIWVVAAQMPRVSGDWTHCRCGPPAAMRSCGRAARLPCVRGGVARVNTAWCCLGITAAAAAQSAADHKVRGRVPRDGGVPRTKNNPRARGRCIYNYIYIRIYQRQYQKNGGELPVPQPIEKIFNIYICILVQKIIA